MLGYEGIYNALAIPMNIDFFVVRGVLLSLVYGNYILQAHVYGNTLVEGHEAVLYTVTIGFTLITLASFFWVYLFIHGFKKYKSRSKDTSLSGSRSSLNGEKKSM